MRRLSILALSAFATLSTLTATASAQTRLWGVSGSTVSAYPLLSSNNQNISIIPDASGGAYVLWTDTGGFSAPLAGFNGNSQCGGPSCNINATIYVTHVSSAGAIVSSWASNVGNNGVLAITNAYDGSNNITGSGYPDGAGGFVIGWTTSSVNTTGAAFAQRYGPTGTALWPGTGDQGGVNTNAVALPGGNNNAENFAVAGTNFFYLAATFSSGNLSGVGVAARNLLDGSQRYAASFWPGITASPNSGGFALADNPSDPGVFFYLEGSSDASDIQAMFFDANGAKWGPASITTNGTPAVTNGQGTANLIAAGDGTGSAYAVWYDTRTTGSGPGIYSAKISGTSSMSIDTVNGYQIATSANNAIVRIGQSQQNFGAAAGEFVIAWSTSSSSNGGSSPQFMQIVNPSAVTKGVLGAGGLDIGFTQGNIFVAASSAPAGSPLFWTTYIPQTNNGQNSQGVYQAYTSTGAAIFPSPAPVDASPVNTNDSSPQAAAGIGHTLALAYTRYNANSGANTFYVQDVSTAVPPLIPPSNVTATLLNAYGIQVGWGDTNSPGASTYLIQVALDAGFQSIAEETTVSSGSLTGPNYSFQMTGLTPLTPYYVRVQSQNGNNVSAFTNASNNPQSTGAGLPYTNAGIGNWTNANALIYKNATVSGSGCATNGALNSNGNCNEGTAFVPAPNGDVFVVWTQDDGSGVAYNVMAQRYLAGNGGVASTFNSGAPLTIAAHVPEGSGKNGGRAGSLAAAADGAGGFAVSFGSGTASELGMAADVSGAGAIVLAPKTFAPAGSQGYGEKNITVSGGVAFSIVADGSGNVYIQGINLSNGNLVASGDGVALTGLSASGNISFSGTPSPANGSFATAGAIFVYGLPGPGNSLKAIRVNVNGGTDFAGTTLNALTNVADNGNPLQTIPDGSGGMYAIWIDTINTRVDALHMPAVGPTGTISTSSVAGGWSNLSSINYTQPSFSLQAILTQAGPVAAWDAPTTLPANQSVNAALLNTGNGVTVWSHVVDTPITQQAGSSTTVEGVAIATNPAGNVEVTYTYGGGADGDGTGENIAELNPANGSVLVAPSNVLANMPDTPNNGGGMPFVTPSGSGFIVGELSAPDIFADMVSSFTSQTLVEIPNGTCSTIQCAVNHVPSPLTGPYTISVAGGVYTESVTVQNIVTGPFQLILESTGAAAASVVSPASSNASFNIYNANVKLEGFAISPANMQTYGVYISSPNVTVDHLNLQDPGGNIFATGIYLNGPTGSNATISNSTVSLTLGGAIALYGTSSSNNSILNSGFSSVGGADGAYFNGGSQEYISRSSFTSVDANDAALYFLNVNGSTITASAIQDLGPGACNSGSGSANGVVFDGSFGNALNLSSVTTNGAGNGAVYLANTATFNSMVGDTIQEGWQSSAVFMDASSGNNTLAQSSLSGNSAFACGGGAVLNISGNSNRVSGTFINDSDTANPANGFGVFFQNGASYNSVQTSTVTVFESYNTAGAFYYQGGNVGNTVTTSYINDTDGYMAFNFDSFTGQSSNNSVSSSTIIESGNTNTAMTVDAATGILLSGLNVQQPSGGDGIDFFNGVSYSTIQQSTVMTYSAANGAIADFGGLSNTLTQLMVSDPGGTTINAGGGDGIVLNSATGDSVSYSTMTTVGSASGALLDENSHSNTFNNLYAEDESGGAYSAQFNTTFGDTVSSSSFLSNGGTALLEATGSGLSVTGSFATDLSGGNGATFENGGSNSISYSTVTTDGASQSLELNDQSDTVTSCSITELNQNTALLDIAAAATITGSSIYSQVNVETNGSTATLAGDTFFNPNGTGLNIQSNAPALTLSSDTFMGETNGLVIEQMPASMTVSTLTFQSMAPFATDINFEGSGVLAATFSYVNFNSAILDETNVNATGLNSGSSLVMLNATGPTAGPSHDVDPNGVITWLTLVVPAAPTGLAGAPLGTSSITWTWNSTPNTTSYDFYFSTGGFVSLSSSTLSYTQTGLNANTTYFAQISALDTTLQSSESPVATAWTTALTPNTPTITAVSSSTVTAAFTSANPAGAVYQAEISADPNFVTGVSTSGFFTGPNYTFTALGAGTVYYVQARVKGNGGVFTPFSAAVSTTTSLVDPGRASTTFTNVYVTSITVAWTSGGNLGATYNAQVLNSGNSVVASSATANAFATFTNLQSNTTYTFQVQAVNGSNSSGFEQLGSTSTLANVPGGLFSSDSLIGYSSATVDWNPNNSYPPNTKYVFQYSTSATFTPATIIVTFSSGEYISDLSGGTSYYFQVAAVNNNGVQTAFTSPFSILTEPPAPASAAGTALSSASISWTWPATQSATGYTVYPATNTATPLGTVSTPAFTESGLTPNATAAILVSASNATGSGPATPSNTQNTYAAVPNAPTITAVSSTSLTAAFTSANAGAVEYQAQLSTAPDFSGTVSTSAFSATASHTFSGLTPSALYYVEVRAEGVLGSTTAFSAATSTSTLAAPPGVSATPFTNVGTSAVTFNWTAGPNGGTPEYEADLSTDPAFGSITVSSDTYNTYATLDPAVGPFGGLTPNTTYYARTRILGNGGANSAYGPSASTSTLAVEPFAAQITGISSTTISVSWAAGFIFGTNPVGTEYFVVASTGSSPGTQRLADDLTAIFVSTNTSPNTVVRGATPDTQYYVAVQAINNNGVGTTFDATAPVSTTTLALPPTGLAGMGTAANAVTWTWNPVLGATSYNLYLNSNAPVSVSTTTYTDSTLSANAPETAEVSAITGAGQTSLSAPVTAYALANAPDNLSTTALYVSSISIAWGENGNPAGTQYLVSYSAIVNGSTQTLTSEVLPRAAAASAHPRITETYSNATITGLFGGTTYYIEVQALNGNGVATVGVSTKAVTGGVASVTSDIGTGGGNIPYTPASGPVDVSVPAGTFTSTVTVTLETPPAGSLPPASETADGNRLTGTGVALQVTFSQLVQPAHPLEITMSYADLSLTAAQASVLVMAQYNPTQGVWVPLPTTINALAQTVTVYVSEFYGNTADLESTADRTRGVLAASALGTAGLFQLMSAQAAANLSAAKVFPNPFRPALGETYITFANLEANTTLKIYDILGEKVREISADASGIAIWDGKNSNGNGVASGVYFVLAGSGGSRTTLKVAIQR